MVFQQSLDMSASWPTINTTISLSDQFWPCTDGS